MSTAAPLGTLHLRHYRRLRRITLERMGEALGISPSGAYYKEIGLQGCTLSQFAIYVQTLCVPPQYLLDIPYTRLDDPATLPRPGETNLIHLPCVYGKGG